MKIKRLLTVIMACILFLIAFSACDNGIDTGKLEAEAAVKLLEAPYLMRMDVSVGYTSDDKEISSVLGDKNINSSMTMNIDGMNFKVKAGTEGFEVEYLFVGDTLYMDLKGSKIKATMSAKDFTDMLGSNVSGIDKMSSDAFSSVKAVKGTDGKVTITCKGLSKDTNELINSFIKDFTDSDGGGFDAVVDKENIEYVVVIGKEGKYESMLLNIPMDSKLTEKQLVINATVKITFDYENAIKLNAPADADDYFDAGDLGDVFE